MTCFYKFKVPVKHFDFREFSSFFTDIFSVGSHSVQICLSGEVQSFSLEDKDKSWTKHSNLITPRYSWYCVHCTVYKGTY